MHLLKFSIKEVPVDEILPLRTRVLRPHYTPPQLAHFDGDHAASTHHFAAFHGDDTSPAVAIVSYFDVPLSPDDIPAVQLRGMAVDPSLRRQGLGAHLFHTTLARLPLLYPTHLHLWCNARESAIPFYLSQGFTFASELFDIPNIGLHRRMIRPIPPALATDPRFKR